MRERFTALEGELVQLREITLSLQTIQSSDQSSNNPTAKQKEGDNIRKELSSLQAEVKQLVQERERLKVQLASLETQLTQQTESHWTQLTALREEIRELKHDKDTHLTALNSKNGPEQQRCHQTPEVCDRGISSPVDVFVRAAVTHLSPLSSAARLYPHRRSGASERIRRRSLHV
ncbi:hypothetical protein E1301_Tti022514 [Triplophysa tibetana]|uniref:Uncharacterized protein n=1 Tax=Triplophysa tibetana TaxID=1572043 RepID=A0A5A9P142_9TELE|nr:hypothetical protein E1301_Tti022514 [Triplophysa tibetana]